jgi:tRNA-dihydrouridine synthase 2
MGSALLKDPERLESILETLVENLPLPITCKIRMLPDTESQNYIERTVDFVQRMAKTGIAAIAIHCRFTFEKPREPGHWEIFEHLVNKVDIPLIANGDFYTLDDVAKFRARVPQITSFLIARGAQSNPSVFRKDGSVPISGIIKEYVELAEMYDIHFSNAKYVLLQMEVPGREGIEFKNRLCRTKNYPDLRLDSFSTMFISRLRFCGT